MMSPRDAPGSCSPPHLQVVLASDEKTNAGAAKGYEMSNCLLRFGAALLCWSVILPAAAHATSLGAAHPHASVASRGALRLPTAPVPSNVTTADPPVPRPDTAPCVVTLFRDVLFEDFTPKPFAFTPPPACPAAWSKVVLTVDLAVTPGVQFDRTATIGLGGATIFFGTTAEPFSNAGPAWRVQRDVTDLSALFTKTQTGQVSIGNVVNSTYTGVISGTARLAFYPPDIKFPAPRTADVVVPLADANGNPVGLSSPASVLATTFVPPTNVERAYLDVIAQSQASDEFWYTCVPQNLAAPLNDCGSTGFRETDAFVDSRPAGVAPVYPWIYTGGIDPFLWAPTPGVQTLNFVPSRVDLTPFAGTLDNRAPHTVAVSVFNADNYFAVTANLLLFLDRDAKALTGGLDVDTLGAVPPQSVQETGSFQPRGTIVTQSERGYVIAGHVTTPHGTIHTQITGVVAFTQTDAIVNAANQFAQTIAQDEQVRIQTSTSGAQTSRKLETFDFPLTLVYDYGVNADNSSQLITQIRQGYYAQTFTGPSHGGTYTFVADSVAPQDELHFDASDNFIGNTGASNTQIYRSDDAALGCYGKLVESKNLVVTRVARVPCGTGKP